MNGKKKKSVKEALQAYCFVAPFVLFGAVFMVYPICNQFIRSLYNTKWGGKTVFVGLSNYVEIFTTPTYLKAIGNTMLFVAVAVPLLILLGLFIAGSIFDKHPVYVSAVRICLYIPTIVSMVVMSTIWRFMLDSQSGLIKYFANIFGVRTVDLLAGSASARIIIIIVLIIVNLGQCVLLYLAQMIGISKDLMDACRVDGGSRWHLFRYILIPLSKPTTILVFITDTSLVLKVYVVIQLLTSGGPNYATSTMMYRLYEDAFVNYNIGLASAMGVLMFITTLVLISLRFVAEKKES